MNVTVMVADALRPAVEGRPKLELGVPSGAELGEVLQTLFELYPKLAQHMPSEKTAARAHLAVYLAEPLTGRRSLAIREGQKVWLFGATSFPPPVAQAAAASRKGRK
ncbi:MAG: hypothetical protein ACOZIN_21795 [Myxococcota bacterium]